MSRWPLLPCDPASPPFVPIRLRGAKSWEAEPSPELLGAIPFSLPDIFAALPDDLVRAAATKGRRSSWQGQEATVRAWSQLEARDSYKHFLLKAVGLKGGPDVELERILAGATPGMRCRPELDQAVRSVLALVRPQYAPESPGNCETDS